MTTPAEPGVAAPAEHSPAAEHSAPYGAVPPQRRSTIRTVQGFKDAGEHFAMLTSYDRLTAGVFDGAGVPVLLVGDSAGNNALAYDDTVPVTVEELLPLVRAVVRGTRRALVVADLPFGSYEISPAQALATGFRMLKEGGAQAVKLEGGVRVAPQIEALTSAGVPVMAHLGFTPQSVHALGGYRVQGRGGAAEALERDALAVVAAGAFAVVLEMVPAELAARITELLPVPTIGIGAGAGCDGQVLVWTDMAGLTEPPAPRFVRRYADLRGVLGDAAAAFVKDVAAGAYPAAEHSFR